VRASKESWGRGLVIEDVWIDKKKGYEDWEPHIQAIRNERGDLAIRFCYYKRKPSGRRGVFVRSPMFVYDFTLKDLRKEVKKYKVEVIPDLLTMLTG
jgi:hypothetical protein